MIIVDIKDKKYSYNLIDGFRKAERKLGIFTTDPYIQTLKGDYI